MLVLFFPSMNILKVNYPQSTDLTTNYAINLAAHKGI